MFTSVWVRPQSKACLNSKSRMEALPMIAPKHLAEGTEFVVTILVSAVAGLLAFLFVALIVNILGL